MSYLNKYLKITCLATILCGLFALITPVASAQSDSGLDDPMFIFCLVNSEPEDLDDCLNGFGLVAGGGDLSAESRGYKIRYKLEAVLVDVNENEPVQHTIYCPHEFGKACGLLIDAVLAFGGTCRKADNRDTWCEID